MDEMEKTLEKLQKLHTSVQHLETVLQEVWSLIDEIGEDQEFNNLMNKAKKSKNPKADQGMDQLVDRLDEFNNSMGEIPEDGTAAVDFEDAIAELIEWIQENK
jgi:hypothetical protein